MGSIRNNQIESWMPYVALIALLVVLYIGNVHAVQKKIHKINKEHKAIEALKREYFSVKKRNLYRGTLNEVVKDIEGVEIKDKVPVPIKISKDA